AVSSEWDNPDNWTEGFVRLPGDDVFIGAGTNPAVITNGEDISIGSLIITLNGDFTLEAGGKLTLKDGSFGFSAGFGIATLAGEFIIEEGFDLGFSINSGQVIIMETGTVSVSEADVSVFNPLTVEGTLSLSGSPFNGMTIFDAGALLITETGTVDIQDATVNGILFAGSQLQVDGRLNIDGAGEDGILHDSDSTLLIGSTGTLTIAGATETALAMEDNRETVNNGTLSIDAPSQVTTLGGSFTNAAGGRLFANGVLGANHTFAANSILGPGNSPGCLRIPTTTDLDGVTLQIELEGTDQCTDYDYLELTSGGDISGITLELSGSYVPEIGDEFTIIDEVFFNNLTGTLVGLPQGSTLTFNGVVLEVSYETEALRDQVILRAIAILPLDLLSFTGQALDKTNLLSWITTNAEDFSHFEVQRSPNGRGPWSVLAEPVLQASGVHEYVDEFPLTTAYYRLKLIDLDGTFTYSEVVYLEQFSGANAGAMKVYPNPSTGRFTVDLTEAGLLAGGVGELRLVDLHGREIWTRLASLDEAIELSHPRAGVYLLTLVTGSGQAFTRRIVIH
ncbi:MAG: T9SS type A sorting domain-containing protein, partial [Bacteroidota bacterium]